MSVNNSTLKIADNVLTESETIKEPSINIGKWNRLTETMIKISQVNDRRGNY